MRPLAALVLAGCLTAGCSADADDGAAPVTRPSDPCANPDAGPLPPECFPEPAVSVPVPSTSADLPPLTLPEQPIDLVRGGNDGDASLERRTFNVTIPAGARLAVTSACRGTSELTVVTAPDSLVEHTLPCNLQEPNEITVLDPKLLSAPVTYQVTVTAPSPARWYVALGAETLPPPPG